MAFEMAKGAAGEIGEIKGDTVSYMLMTIEIIN